MANPSKNPSEAAPAASESAEPGIFEAIFGRKVLSLPLVQKWLALPWQKRDAGAMAAFAALLFLPWLGAVGLWDCWEPHYGEVARTMVAKQDYVFPYWENAYFFSKPPLTMWLQALGLLATGSMAKGGALGVFAEWGMRLPFALLSILAVTLVTHAVGRVFSRRAGLIAGFATATSPLFFLLARHTITDTPFVTLVTSGIACFLIAEFDPEVRGELTDGGAPKSSRATAWWCWAYAFFGLATLAKGLLGFMLPGLMLLVFVVVSGESHEPKHAPMKRGLVASMLASGDWRLLKRARIVHGVALLALIAVPWILTLSLFDGKDDESKTFFYRFFIHDHFKRIAEGVHTTTPGGTFSYFIEQLGFAIFPWVALIPGAMVVIGKISPRDADSKSRATLFVAIWAAAAFFVFAGSATKFHHYCFPAVPPLVILCALFADKLWREGIETYAVPVILGIAFFGIIAQNLVLEPKILVNLFIYNYDRAYPLREVSPQDVFRVLFVGGGLWLALAYFWRSKPMLVGTFAALAAAFALYVSWSHWTKLSFHWSQRDIFYTYYQQRGSGDEPIAAYYMNWRGETFYSSNTVRQIKDGGKFTEFLSQPGRKWIVVEQTRFNSMKTLVEQQGQHARVEERSNNKYLLASVQ